MKGYLTLVLHAHLPFIRHPEDENTLEERWFYEALTETYLPLIKVFKQLAADKISFRLTLSLTPPLVAMFSDSLLQQRYLQHLEKMQKLAEQELSRTKGNPQFYPLAQMYKTLLEEAYYLFHEVYKDNFIFAWQELAEMGYLELITSCATHGYLPLLGLQREVVWAQAKLGRDYHIEKFGFPPAGIWLPECGYSPGDDEILKELGFKYFILDTHGILFASPRPRYAYFAPLTCPSGVAAFGRDVETSKQVWSAQEGYPGDFDYREFYRDIGYDLDFEYLRPFLHPEGIRTDTGFKYYRITGKTDWKEPYVPAWAQQKASLHAGNFMFNRERQIEYLAKVMDRPPLIVAPYDAELFGHWWFEGPLWLNYLFRKINFDQNVFTLITPGDYLKMFPVNQVAIPCMSSWGYQGYHEVWLNGSNDWIYRHLHHAAARIIALARRFPQAEGILKRALNQAARELLLAESSDWAFIMKTGTMAPYAVKRTKEHLRNFTKLYTEITQGQIDLTSLEALENKNNIFPHINYRTFASLAS